MEAGEQMTEERRWMVEEVEEEKKVMVQSTNLQTNQSVVYESFIGAPWW